MKDSVASSPPALPTPTNSLPNSHYQGLCQQYGSGALDQSAAMHAAAAAAAAPPFMKDNTATHPAFPVNLPLLFQHGAAASSYNFNHLQHVFARERTMHPGQFSPDTTPKSFMDFGRMGGHMPFGKKLFGCPQCRYITDRKNNLKRHVATMHQECDKVLECCGVVFKNKASLRDHVLIFHSNGYMCRYCGRNFCRKALLKRHLTVHSGQKDYVCTVCDYATSHKSNLERHKKVHERQIDGEGMPHSPAKDDGRDEDDCSADEAVMVRASLLHDLPRNVADQTSSLGAESDDDNADDDQANTLINVVDLPN